MAGEVAPNAQSASDMSLRDTLRDQELGAILRGVLRVRVAFLPVVIIFLTLLVLYDPDAWKVTALGVVAVFQLAVTAFDALRLRRRSTYATRFLPLDYLLMVLLQTSIIWLTGAIESPLIVIYVPLGVMSGVALGPGRVRWLLVGLMSLLLWLMTLAGLWGWMPRTVPSFLDLGPGFLDRPVYALTTAAILNLVVVLGSVVGGLVHRAILRMLDQAIGARQQALESLTDRNQELVTLSSSIAHELKNPLASIHGLVQLLDRPGDPERQGARLEVLRREVTRMREILDEFLNFSRPLGELTVQPIQPESLFDEISSLHEGLAQARRVRIARPTRPVGPVACDGRKVKQALINLLQNALEATPPGGEVAWVARPVEGDPDLVELGVRDSGPGISADLLERATQAGVTSKPGGSGIGLAVARAIAEQHGGRLTLRNLAGGGCEALLQLPVAPQSTKEEKR